MGKKILTIGIISMFLLLSFSSVTAIKTNNLEANTDQTLNHDNDIEIKDDASLVIVTLKRNGKKLTGDSVFWGSYEVFADEGYDFAAIGSEPYEVQNNMLKNCFYGFLEKNKKHLVGVNYKPTMGTRWRKAETYFTPEGDIEEITLEWTSSMTKSRINSVFDSFLSRLVKNFPFLNVI